MSAPIYPNDDGRLDRSLRSSMGSSKSAHSVTDVGSHPVTAPHLNPWSQHGTLLDNTPPSEHQATDITPTVHAHANSSHGLPPQPTGGPSSRLPLASPRYGQQLVDTNIPEHLISPTSTAPPPSTPDEVRCRQCNVPFTGDDKTNNLARHIRTQHHDNPLRCTKCDVVCTRNDALLKHERKCQPGLHPDPVKRKKNKTDTATTPSRETKARPTPRRRPGKRSIRNNLASAPQTPRTHAPIAHPVQASYTLPDTQQAPSEGSLAHDFFNVRGAGNGLSIPSQSYDPAAGEDQDFQQLHNDLQQAVEAAPLQQAVWPFRFGQQNLAPYNTVRQEGWPSPQHLYPLRSAHGFGHPLSPANVSGNFGSANLSTLPSPQPFDTASSSYLLSTYPCTGPTSIHGSVDPTHQSPLASPFSCYSPSLPSAASPYNMHQDIPSAQGSLSVYHHQALPRSDESFVHSQEDNVSSLDLFLWSPPLGEDLGQQNQSGH